jgi:hypothetical protein
MSRALFIITSLVLIFFLVACQSQPIQIYSDESRSIDTSTSLVASPQGSPSSTSHPSTTATKLPSPIETPLFPTPEGYVPGHMVSTRKPIVTPMMPSDRFTLKEWTEKDALNLIQVMDKYAYESDLYMPAASRAQFQSAQYPVRISILEALYQFPDIPQKREIEWRFALANAIQGNSASNTWIIATIENYLNESLYSLEHLQSTLINYGFELIDIIPVTNLFSDNLDAYVVQVTPRDGLRDGLFIAIRIEADGSYKPISIYNSWAYDYGWYSAIVDDHNGNGTPEVVLTLRHQSGTMCSNTLLIYEWQQDRFVELTKGQLDSNDCLSSWEFLDEDENGARLLEFKMDDYLFSLSELYKWNGSYFELFERSMDPPYAWAISLMEQGDYTRAQRLIEDVIDNRLLEYTDMVGPGFPDFMRFQLGMIAALSGEYEEAKAIFISLANNPFDPNFPVLSNASQAYLNEYNQRSDIYRSCQAARDYLNTIIANAPMEEHQSPYSIMRDVWNYEPMTIYSWPHICDLDSAFRMLVEEIIDVDGDDLFNQLLEYGIRVRHIIPLDLYQDGKQDYIVLVENADGIHPCDRIRLWVLMSSDQGYVASRGECIWYQDSPREMHSSIVQIPGVHEPGIILQMDDSLYVIKFDQMKQGVSSIQILDEIFVNSYEVINTDAMLELHLDLTPASYRPIVGRTYKWNEEIGEFIFTDRIEEELFANKNSSSAIPLINEVVSYLIREEGEHYNYLPRFFYLLGLAHELSGDNVSAVDTYWRIWHDFSDSPYAIMARYKLELQVP